VKTRVIITDFMTRNNLLDPKIIPNEEKVPLPNGTNTAMINQNSYKKIHEIVIFREQTE
jgi:hypothetical protein